MHAAPPRPEGKVQQEGKSWRPVLRFRSQTLPLGLHSRREVAEAAYDAAKIRGALDLPVGKVASQLKLHRPAATYTQHPLWQHLLPPHCSCEAACRLLAGGLAAGFLAPAEEAAAHLHAARARVAPSAAAAAAAAAVPSAAAAPASIGAAVPAAGAAADPTATAAIEPQYGLHAPALTPAPVEQLAGSTPCTTARLCASGGSGAAAAEGSGTTQPLAAKPRWLEFPAGSGQYATALSPSVASSGELSLPLWITAASFPAIGMEPRGGLKLLPAAGNDGQPPSADIWHCKWSTQSKGSGLRRVLRLPKDFLAVEQLKPGDVFVAAGSTSRRICYRIWRAGSADAQRFADFERVQPNVGRQVKRAATGDGRGRSGSGRSPKRARKTAAVWSEAEYTTDEETEMEEEPSREPSTDAERGSPALFPLHAAAAPAAAAGVQHSRPEDNRGVFASNWGEPQADGCVLTLTESLARLKRGNRLSLPERHAQAIFGHAPLAGMQHTAVSLITPDGSQHMCALGRATHNNMELKGSGVGGMVATLAGAAGDQLRFQPAGPMQARVVLVPVLEQRQQETAAMLQGGQPQGQGQQQGQQQQQHNWMDADAGQQHEQEQQRDAQGHGLGQTQHTNGAAAIMAAAAGGVLPDVGSLGQDEGLLWTALDDVCRRMESEGGIPAETTHPYRLALTSTPSNRWRLAHYCILRAFAERGAWEQAAAWMRLASSQT